MCQLLALNAQRPTAFSYTFRKFCHRGGCGDIHKDGWGMCFYEGERGGIRSFYDTAACCHSPTAKFVQQFPARTANLLSHIRYMTHGEVSIENLHPFTRELWGIAFCFAHNGDVPLFAQQDCRTTHHILLGKAKVETLAYHPIGDTDSEAVFCAILDALRAEFRELPTLHVLHDFLARLCEEIVNHKDGVIFNFILACGPHTLFAYSWPGRRPPSTTWNGLHYLIREESTATATPSTSSTSKLEDEDFALDIPHQPQVTTATSSSNDTSASDSNKNDNSNRIAIVATKPLTDEPGWIEMKPRELLMFDRGVAYSKSTDLDAVECQGHGLASKCFPKAECPVCSSSNTENSIVSSR